MACCSGMKGGADGLFIPTLGCVSQNSTCVPAAVSWSVQSSHNTFALMRLGFSHGAVGLSILLTCRI